MHRLFGAKKKPVGRSDTTEENCDHADRRRNNRLWCKLDVKFYADGKFLAQGSVVNLSDTGLGLFIESDIELPATFEIQGLSANKLTYVEQVWRHQDRVGTRFVKEGQFSEKLQLTDF